MHPLLTVVIPTRGRPGLVATLASVRAQANPAAVELLCVGDTHAATWTAALALVPAWCVAADARYLAHDGGAHAWGHPQRTYGQQHARGQWLAFLQDDAVWCPDAWATLQRHLLAGRVQPHLFRVVSRYGRVWQTPVVAEGNVDADGLVTPNRPERLGTWGRRHAGDFDMIAQTVARWDGRVCWDTAQLATHVGP